MNQITIDREGARRLYERITQQNGELDPGMADEFLRAVGDAAAGDFAALAELVGTREVKRNATTDRTACVMCGARTNALIGAERLADACEAAVKLGPARGGIDARSPIADALLDYRDPADAKVEGAPAPAPDFRVDDEFQMYPASDDGHGVLRVEWPARNSHGALDCIRVRDGAKMSVHLHAVDPATLRRRHFRAGERCGALHKGQARELDGLRGVVQWVDPDGPGVEIVFDGGRVDTLGQRHVTEDTVLAADWSAPEAVPCEVKP